ncbi:hypothetical protein C7U68_01685 [Bradyrhizobium sp. WBAH33]|nr:hypothetical protein [Bradyrhizobium sp. WBAH33]
MGGLQKDFVATEAPFLQLADDQILQFRTDLQQVKRKKKDSTAKALEQNCSDFDGIEDIAAGGGPRWVASEPDGAVARRDIPVAHSRNDLRHVQPSYPFRADVTTQLHLVVQAGISTSPLVWGQS